MSINYKFAGIRSFVGKSRIIIPWRAKHQFALKNKMQGYKFLRQRPVMNFIADFMCPELMLIIETDGASHLLEGAEKILNTRSEFILPMLFSLLWTGLPFLQA